LEQTSGQQCLRSGRALEAAGGVKRSRRALANLARREGASSILCSSFAKFGIILFFGGGFQASWAEEERGG
jgi:hypothetical protein